MPQIAILAAIEIGLAVAQYALTPKGGKQQPVDRGRQGDLRFTLAAENEPLPYAFGRRVRIAGVMVDFGRTKEIRTSTPGSSGGKKGQGGTPPTTNYSYTKTFAIAFTANEMKSFRQIKEDDTIILDLIPENATSNFYEGEDGSNTFTGHTQVVAYGNASNGYEVTLQAIATNGAVQFNNVLSNVAGTRTLVIYYRNDTDTPIELTVNGGAPATYTLENSGNVNYATRAIDITCVEGLNTIKIKNTHATHNMGIDRVYLFAGLPSTDEFNPRRTGVVADIDYPSDPDDPSAFYDFAPYPDINGRITGQLSTNGQAPFELFLGKDNQPQSDILMSLPDRNSSNTPAYEELSLAIFQDYHIQDGRQTLGNITAELEPKLKYVDEILEFLYALEGATAEQMDFSAGADMLEEGFLYDRRDALAPYVAALGEAHGFDIVPIDGKLVLVKRGGASVFTIPEEEMYGREEGGEMPKGPISTEHTPQSDIPNSVDVVCLDPSSIKEFHTSDQRVTRQVGNSLDPDTLTLPLVREADAAIAIGKRYLWTKKLRSKPKSFATGPRYRHLTPGDVGTLVTEQATEKVVLTSTQAAFTGLCKFKAVPEKGALYSQTGPANPQDSERPPVPYPANTFLWLGDLPPLRLQDDLLGYYGAVCPRGVGSWRGAHLFKEVVEDDWQRAGMFRSPAMIGVLVDDMDPITDPLATDITTQMTVNFYFDDGSIESRTLDDLVSGPVNRLIIGSGAGAEVLAFGAQSPQTFAAPYRGKYIFSTLLRGLNGTEEGATAGHAAGDVVVVFSDAVQFFQEEPITLHRPFSFAAPTAGQALPDAITHATEFILQGYSKRPLSIANPRGDRDSAENLLIEFEGRARSVGGFRPDQAGAINEEGEQYRVQILDGGSTVLPNGKERVLPVAVGMAQAAAFVTDSTTTGDKFDSIDVNSLAVSGTDIGITARALQTILRTGNFFEATLIATGAGAATIGFRDAGRRSKYEIFVLPSIISIGVRINDGVAQYIGTYDTGDEARLRITLSGSEVRFYLNYAGPGTPPVYVSGVAPEFPLTPFASAASGSGGTADINKAILTTSPFPKTIYSAAQQVEDFGSTQAAIEMDIWQESPIVGPGAKTRVTL